jgi:hypothetical protein
VGEDGDAGKGIPVSTIVRARGGSGWESNPPWLARRYPSTVLKTAEATRPQPPPRMPMILTFVALVKGDTSPRRDLPLRQGILHRASYLRGCKRARIVVQRSSRSLVVVGTVASGAP